jgi:hypothetical protein
MIYVSPDTREYPDALCAICARPFILKYRAGYNDHVCSEICAKLDCFPVDAGAVK